MAKIKDIELANEIDNLGLVLINNVLSKARVGHIIMDMDDYNKNDFNDSLDQLKPKHVKFFKGLAVSLLDIVRRFNLIIDSRIYNMLRYLELNR